MKNVHVKSYWLLLALAIFLVACRREEPTPTPPFEDAAEELPPAVPTEPASLPTQVVNYSLGETTILQDHFSEDSPFREMPVRLDGVIGVPEGDQHQPVVLIMHGSHFTCPGENEWPCSADDEQKNYEGFTYLVEALAESGYLALSINVNAEHTFGFGEAPPTLRTQQLIDLHLGELAAANAGESEAFGLDLTGRADLSQMVWLGHSRGGDNANWIIRDNDLIQSANEIGPYGPVQGLILLAPPTVAADSLPSADLPTGLIVPACDGDDSPLNGLNFYETARLDPERENFFTSVYLENANHNNFNSTLPPDPILQGRPDCEEALILAPEAQQDFLAAYTLDFLQTIYGAPDLALEARQRLGIMVSEPAPEELYGLPAVVNLHTPSPDRLLLIQPESATELSQNLLGGEVELAGIEATFCPSGYTVSDEASGTKACKRHLINQPGNPQQLALQWEAPGAELRTTLPESFADLSPYATLQLMVSLDPLSDLNLENQPQSFTLELVDGGSQAAQVIVPNVEYPLGSRQFSDIFEEDFYRGNIHLKSVRIPLTEFEGVDLTNISQIGLLFDQTPSGALFLADLALLNSG